MTLKEKAFIKETIKHKNPTKGAELSYNIGSKGGSKTPAQAKSVATSIAHEKLTKPDIRKRLEDYLPDDLILGALRDDITDKPRNRATELNLATKIRGLQQDKLDITSNNQAITGFNYIKPNKESTEGVLKPVKEPINTKQP